MFYIYRKAERDIVGHVFDRKTKKSNAEAIQTEVKNLTNSELGGTPEDYGVLEGAENSGTHLATVTSDFELEFRMNPKIALRESALAKLHKSAGLTSEESAALTE